MLYQDCEKEIEILATVSPTAVLVRYAGQPGTEHELSIFRLSAGGGIYEIEAAILAVQPLAKETARPQFRGGATITATTRYIDGQPVAVVMVNGVALPAMDIEAADGLANAISDAAHERLGPSSTDTKEARQWAYEAAYEPQYYPPVIDGEGGCDCNFCLWSDPECFYSCPCQACIERAAEDQMVASVA